MVKFIDYYSVLGVRKSADANEIRSAFRTLAQRHHPDVDKSQDAEDKFKEINEAYDVLGDVERKRKYDNYSLINFGREVNQIDLEKFQSMFYGNSTNDTRIAGQRGSTSESDFFNALFGARTTKKEQFDALKQGHFTPDEIEKRNRKDSFNAFVDEQAKRGARIVLDKDAKLKTTEDSRWKISGKDVYILLNLAPWEAILGSKLVVDTPRGSIKLSIPNFVQNGQKLRLKGRGISGTNLTQGDDVGDLFIELRILMPTELNAREVELFEELASISKFNPRAKM